MTKSLGPAFGAEVDHVRLARLLRRAHTIALDTGVAPRVVRQVVSESWSRSVEAGVDPGRLAPRMLDAHDTALRLAAHPIVGVLPKISELLSEAMVESAWRDRPVRGIPDGACSWPCLGRGGGEGR
jgi:hypothetical protein